MIITPNTAVRIPVRLIDSLNTSITGALPADVTNGSSASNLSVVKGDGTVYNIALTNNVNWFEIDDVAAPGLYHVLVPAGGTDTLGSLVVVVLPAASLFLETFIACQVKD